MSEEINAVIDKIAAKLEVPASQLIEWYAVRAPWEWIDVLLVSVLLALSLVGAVLFSRVEAEKGSDKEFGAAAGMLACLAASVILVLLLVTNIDKAVMATVSPEAYAFERILSKFK